MGCDIHFYVERFSDEPITNGPIDISEQRDQKISSILEENKIEPRWISADKWVLGDDKRWEYIDRFYSGRNYNLFSILAGVRTWEEDVAICKPKGIPEDSSYAYKYEIKHP